MLCIAFISDTYTLIKNHTKLKPPKRFAATIRYVESVTPVLGNLHPSAILDNLHFNCSQQLIEQNQHKQTDGLDTSTEKSEPRAAAQCALVVYLNIVCSVRAQSVILWTLDARSSCLNSAHVVLSFSCDGDEWSVDNDRC